MSEVTGGPCSDRGTFTDVSSNTNDVYKGILLNALQVPNVGVVHLHLRSISCGRKV